MTLRADVARSLERGRGGVTAAVLAAGWSAVSSRGLERRLIVPEQVAVVCVGGSTLGGSGKTPVAIACATLLAAAGRRVAFIGHGYGGDPGRGRVVAIDDPVDVVGDEALMAARRLAPEGVSVFVGPTRQAAVDAALAVADILVLDGVSQLRPRRATLALLVVDGSRPWGSGACPPAGDLRAARSRLVTVCDRIVAVGRPVCDLRPLGRPLDSVEASSAGAMLGGELLGWDDLRARRVALWTALARPQRVLDGLAREGVTPVFVAAHSDHARVSRVDVERCAAGARAHEVDLWLTTAKCVTRLGPASRQMLAAPVATLSYDLSIGPAFRQALLLVDA
jgi:tetraacyldisaccharide 4'-kinase